MSVQQGLAPQRTGVVEGDALEHDRVQLGIALARQALQLVTQGIAHGPQAAALQLPFRNLHGVGNQLRALLTCLGRRALPLWVHRSSSQFLTFQKRAPEIPNEVLL